MPELRPLKYRVLAEAIVARQRALETDSEHDVTEYMNRRSTAFIVTGIDLPELLGELADRGLTVVTS